MLVFFDGKTLIATLIEMSAAGRIVRAIALDVRIGHPRNIRRQIQISMRAQGQVPVIAHQAERKKIYLRMTATFDEQADESLKIRRLAKDGLPIVPAIEHM